MANNIEKENIEKLVSNEFQDRVMPGLIKIKNYWGNPLKESELSKLSNSNLLVDEESLHCSINAKYNKENCSIIDFSNRPAYNDDVGELTIIVRPEFELNSQFMPIFKEDIKYSLVDIYFSDLDKNVPEETKNAIKDHAEKANYLL